MRRDQGPLYTVASGARAVAVSGLPQQPQPWPQLVFDPALLLAREYKSLMDRARQRQLQEVQAQLSNGTSPGFRTVGTT